MTQAFERARLRWLPKRLHPPEGIPKAHERLLILVGAAAVIADYDVTLYGLAVSQIQKDLLIPEDQVTTVIAIFRTGIIPALVLAYLADIIGRRLLLMITLAGAALATVATSFAQDLTQFVVAQTIARMFIYCEELLCVVVVAEEFSERTRGWAVGAIGAFGALGAGLAAAMFALVDLLPYGWRALYFLGAFPLLWLLWARRTLPETKRFQSGAEEGQTLGSKWLRPAVGLVTQYPGRLAILLALVAPMTFGLASAITLISKFLQESHGYAPWQVSALIVGSGVIAIIGNFAAGLASDRLGRKLVMAVSLVVATASLWLIYKHASGWMIVPLWTVALFANFAIAAIVAAFGAELFPTSYRAVASGLRVFVGLFFGALGLLLEGRLFNELGSHGAAVSALVIVTPLALIPLMFLPETASRSLEDIAPERRKNPG